MPSKTHTFISKFTSLIRRTNKYVLIAIALIIIFILYSLFSGSSQKIGETALVTKGSIVEKVDVTGKVAPFQKADLGFEKAGAISKINFKVGDQVKAGDIIATLDNSDTDASLAGAYANLQAENAKLSEMVNGLRPEELDVEESKVQSSSSALEDAKIALVSGLHDSYVKTETAIYNYSDSLFTNPQTPGPVIKVNIDNYTTQIAINSQRVIIGIKLKEWKTDLDSLTLSSDPLPLIKNVHSHLESIKSFLSNLSDIVSKLSTGNSGLTQTQIDTYSVTINTALSTFNTAVSTLASAEANYRSANSSLSLAKNELALKKAQYSTEDLQIQEAKVSQAQASVANYQAEIAKKTITAPIDGIVSRANPEMGEFVSAGVISFGVISNQTFKVEINVPEVDIIKISVDNPVKINLDAYDADIVFNGKVVSIDPAETIVEGVPTYKVTVQFESADSKVRSGMTANIDIVTQSKENVLVVPTRAIINKSGEKKVRVVKGSGFEEITVTTGARGSDGMTEILSGLSEGDTVVTLVK